MSAEPLLLPLTHCTIRNWREEDIPSLAEHANDKKVWLNLTDLFPHPYKLSDAEEWIQIANNADPITNFAITIDGHGVGGIGLKLQSDVYKRTAEIGYWLGQKFWGRGIVTEALAAFTDHAFERYDLARIYAGVFDWNPASAKVLEKAGYQFEGRLKKAAFKDGKVIDTLLYAVTR